MEENQILSFIAEWYDPHPQITKEFCVRYFSSTHELEMKDISNGRKFLKKTKLPQTIKKIDFAVGNNISLFSRDMKLVDYGDSNTRSQLDAGNEATVIIASIEPRSLGSFLTYFEELRFTIATLQDFKLQEEKEIEKYQTLLGIKFEFCKRMNIMLSIKGTNSINRCFKEKANLCKLFGNVVCASSLQEVSDYLVVLADIRNPVESFDKRQSTCCIVKRHVLQSRQLGSMINYILSNSFKIRGIRLVHLNISSIEEFYGAYKGVLENYNDVINSFNGPVVAVEVYSERDEDVVQSFREFSGPWDADIAKELYPDSIRAKFGKCAANNGMHCTDLTPDAPYELAYFFDILAYAR